MPDSSNPELRRLLQLFLEQTTDHAVICMDPHGIVIGWLGAAEEILGYSPAEALGQSGRLIFTREDRERGFDEHELAVARQTGHCEDDRWHVRQDETRIWLSGSVYAIRGESDELLGYVKLVRDKTDLRTQIETLDNESRALKKSLERTHRFLSTLGHELRNPLSPMQTAAHIMRRASTDPKIDKAAEVIVQQIGVVTRLAEDLMEVSRAGAGKIQLDLATLDLRSVLNQAVESMQRTADEKRVKLRCLMPDSSLDVQLDAQRFQRVVLNLLGNAIKYTPAGGTVYINATQEGNEVLFRIQDTGIGIAPEVLPRIFDLFTQEHQAADLVPGGLGIGLTIVKELVELHGGTVQARSAGRGKGAEFTVRLPPAERGPEPGG